MHLSKIVIVKQLRLGKIVIVKQLRLGKIVKLAKVAKYE